MTDAMDIFLDTILPDAAERGLPAGSCIDVTRPTSHGGMEAHLPDILALLDAAAGDLGAETFSALTPDDRLKAVERAKRKDMRLMTAMIIHCLRLYYTEPKVLRCLSAGAVPPFPQGNAIEDDDWTILEPVYEKGPIYRPVDA